MTIKGKTARVEDVLASVERFAEEAKLVSLDLAGASARAREANCVPHKVSEEIMDLVDKSNSAANQILEMIRMVRMEMGEVYYLTEDGEVKLNKNRELVGNLEVNLKKILERSDRVLEMVKKLRSLSLDNLVA
jgi:methyl-accepting chemotaxis protein